MKNVLMILLTALLLTGCNSTTKLSSVIPSCRVPDDIEQGAKWIDLLDKYLETRSELVQCAEKVERHNGSK